MAEEQQRKKLLKAGSAAPIVRPLTSSAEYTRYYQLSNKAFAKEPSEEEAERWRDTSLHSPNFRAERVRGAFRAGQQLGGYTLEDRVLRMGAARISTGCIGAVVTAPEARQQGAARALMQDALAFAHEHNHTLLLLDGIPAFYHRFGYTNICAASQTEIDCSAILAQPATDYQVRPVTIDDAPAILDLYQRHLGGYTGSFERSLDLQTYRLLHYERPPVVALSPQGEIEGYLFHGTRSDAAKGYEITADTWEALITLLRYHALLFDEETAPTALIYTLPPATRITHWLIDRLEVRDTSQWDGPMDAWSLRTQINQHHFTGWMACLINFPLLLESMLPELQERWQRALSHWSGEISLEVAGQTRVLCLNGETLHLAESPTAATASRLELSPQALVQLAFGYRPLEHLISTAALPRETHAVLNLLFPANHTWIPRSDWF